MLPFDLCQSFSGPRRKSPNEFATTKVLANQVPKTKLKK